MKYKIKTTNKVAKTNFSKAGKSTDTVTPILISHMYNWSQLSEKILALFGVTF